jgi:hypothetical protein
MSITEKTIFFIGIILVAWFRKIKWLRLINPISGVPQDVNLTIRIQNVCRPEAG